MTGSRLFAALLLVRSDVGGHSSPEDLIDHQVRVFTALDEADAQRRAFELGKAEEQSYLNEAGETVSWRFIGTHDVKELLTPDLTDGTEVFSWLTGPTDALEVSWPTEPPITQ